jgi:hypothetical protein
VPGAGSVAAQTPAAADASPTTSEEPAAAQRFLSAHELETLAGIGDQLVPGCVAAGVPALADRVLSVETGEVQRRVRNALGAFEHEARARHAKAWIELSPTEQGAILDAAAKTPSAQFEPPAWTKGQPVLPPGPPPEPPPASLQDHLVRLRDFVASLYFATEPGMRELGWEGNLFWDGLPECDGKG